MLYARVAGGAWHQVLAAKEIWSALWPILIGVLLWVALRRWPSVVPRVPAGDVVVLGGWATSALRGFGAAMERLDARLSQWPMAGILFAALTIVLIVAMRSGH